MPEPFTFLADDPEFMGFLRNQEGAARPEKRFQVNPSLEGGTATFGYGHKLKPGEVIPSHFGEVEADKFLYADAIQAEQQVSSLFRQKMNRPYFALDANRKAMLVDMGFNLGASSVFTEFPSFVQHLTDNNYAGMAREYKRFYRDSKTQKMLPLKKRNQAFYQRFIEPYLTDIVDATDASPDVPQDIDLDILLFDE